MIDEGLETLEGAFSYIGLGLFPIVILSVAMFVTQLLSCTGIPIHTDAWAAFNAMGLLLLIISAYNTIKELRLVSLQCSPYVGDGP